jgi:N-methylhydantoinase A
MRMGCEARGAAAGIIDVANAAMSRALRHISVERGCDPAEYTLVSFGGAGGLHACDLAALLGIRRILVPRYPGAFSALGLALADVRREYVAAIPPLRLEPVANARQLAAHYDLLLNQAGAHMTADGFREGHWAAEPIVDLRYVGQSFELRIPFTPFDLHEAARRFHAAHLERYGHSDCTQPVELTAVRVTAIAVAARPEIRPATPASYGTPIDGANVVCDGQEERAAIYRRESLAVGQDVSGAAIVLQDDATTLILPGWTARVDGGANLVIERAS